MLIAKTIPRSRCTTTSRHLLVALLLQDLLHQQRTDDAKEFEQHLDVAIGERLQRQLDCMNSKSVVDTLAGLPRITARLFSYELQKYTLYPAQYGVPYMTSMHAVQYGVPPGLFMSMLSMLMMRRLCSRRCALRRPTTLSIGSHSALAGYGTLSPMIRTAGSSTSCRRMKRITMTSPLDGVSLGCSVFICVDMQCGVIL